MAIRLAVVGQAGDTRSSLLAALGLSAGDDRLVHALLDAGPRAIDAYLLVVASDVGITAEVREHAALLRALGVQRGLSVVIAGEAAALASVLQEIRAIIPDTQAHAVSLRTADGLPALRHALADLLAAPPAPEDPPAARFAGATPLETRVIDAALDFGAHREREPEHGVSVIVHLGGTESRARLHRLGGRFWQVRLDEPLPATAGDRFVIRRPDPPGTLGGGVVLDPAARRHPTSNEAIVRLTRIWRGQPPLPPEPPRRS